MNTNVYKAFFEQSSELLVVIDTDFNILNASNAYLKTTRTLKETIVGQHFFTVFPNNPNDITADGESNIRASFNRVLENKIPDTINVVKYDIPKPEKEGGGFMVKYWQPCHTPVLDEFNNVKYIIQCVKDVTENEELIAELELEKTELKKVEDSEKRYNLMLMKSPFGFAIFKGENMVITLANDSIKDFWGKGKDVEGKPLFDLIPELRESDFPQLINDVYTTGIPFYGDELLAPIIRNGKLEDAYFNFVYQPYLEADETISGVTIIAYEVTPKALLKNALAEQLVAEQKALKSIEESTKRHYNMLMESPFAFCILKGKDLVISLANDLIKEFWSKGKDVEGKPLLELLPELINQPFPSIINNVYETGIPYYANEILAQLTNNGKLVDKYFNVVYQAIREADDTISGVTTIAYEVTENVLSRKKIEENDTFNRSVLNASPDCIKILDAEGRLQFMNENGICLLEIDDFNLFKDKYWWELWEEDNKQLIKDAVAKAHTGQKVQFQAQRVTAKGTCKWWDIIVLPIKLKEPSDKSGSLICVSRDITDYRNATLKVKEAEHRYQEMIYSSPSLILILNGEDLIVTFSNNAMLEVLGKGSDIINKPLLDVIPEVIEQGLGDLLLKVFRTGEPQYGYEFPVQLIRDGEPKLFHFTFVYQAQRNLNGDIEGVAVIAQEVTPQALLNQKIKASEEQFRQLADLMPAKISNADIEGNLTYFNNQWLDYTGLSFEVLKNFGYHTIMHPDEIQEFQERFANASATKTVLEMEMRFLNKYGQYKWHLNLASPVLDEQGNIKMWVGSTTEIHEQLLQKSALELAVKQRTEALEIANKELQFQNNEKEKRSAELVITNKELAFQSSEKEKRADELLVANKELAIQGEEKEKRAAELILVNKELESFTYISSHDLQEPLRKIQTFAARILEKEHANLSANGKDYFHRMQNAAHRMQTLIEDLLSYSRTNITERKFEKADLNKLVADVENDLSEIILEKNAVIEVGELCELNINPSQFKQVINNLVTNALKFSKPNIQPQINIVSTTAFGSQLQVQNTNLPFGKLLADQSYCHITFTDNGIGFEPEYRDKIFELFQRLHSKEEYVGTGIGLAIVRKIIDNHNGIITAFGALNQGAKFDIYIPVE